MKNNSPRGRDGEQGIALVLALFMVLVMSVLGSSLVFVSQTETLSSHNYRLMSQARYGAESGLHKAANYLLSSAFPGLSGFKYDRRPPHRVEGGACQPLTPEERGRLRIDSGPLIGGNGPILEHCRGIAHALVVALHDLEHLHPTETAGLL